MIDLQQIPEPALDAKRPIVERLVIRLKRWFKIRAAKQLHRRIWKANAIILQERHGRFLKKQNKPFWDELNKCADALEHAAGQVRKSYDDV